MQNKSGNEFLLDQISLINFKGAKNKTFHFSDHITTIRGKNKAGKTTIYDAFLWILFDKDSNDKSVFGIKPRDINGFESSNIDVCVEIKFRLNGVATTARKTLREKWVRKTGDDIATLKGNENLFEWNGINIKAGEFEDKIKSIFSETIFRLITNTRYFASLKTDDRRIILSKLAGSITDDDVFNDLISSGEDIEIFKSLKQYLLENPGQDKAVSTFKREIASKMLTIQKQFDTIPTRIDETERILKSKVTVKSKKLLLEDVSNLNLIIADADNKIGDRATANKIITDRITKQNNEISVKQMTADNIYNAVAREFNNKKNNYDNLLASKKSQISQIDNEIFVKTKSLERITTDSLSTASKQSVLRSQWMLLNAQQFIPNTFEFDENKFSCPTCHRVFDDVNIEDKKAELLMNFNNSETNRKKEFIENKRIALNENTARGKSLQDEILTFNTNADEIRLSIKGLNESKTLLVDEHSKMVADRATDNDVAEVMKSNQDYVNLLEEIRVMRANRDVLPNDDLEELKRLKADSNITLDHVKSQLHFHDSIDTANIRIKELHDDQAKLSQELADLERIEKSIKLFVSSKMNTVTARINGMFGFVKFRMFKTLLNGAIEDDCEIMIDGVPYPDANHAAQINAGLDIINTLCREYHVNAPCFIDNVEAINYPLEISSQVIKLAVSFDDELVTS